jgi:hypothetical protein
VAGEVDRPVDEDRQVRVDLDQAVEVSLVPVVAAPRLAGHVLDHEALIRRQLDVLERPPPALVDGGLEDRVEPVAGDDEPLPERLDPGGEGAVARDGGLELVEDALEVGGVVGGSDGVVERLRLLVKSEFLAGDDVDPRHHRLELPLQVLVAQPDDLLFTGRLAGWGRMGRELGDARLGLGADLGERAPLRLGLGEPLRRAVVGVHVVGVVLPDGEHQLDVGFGGPLHRVFFLRRRGRERPLGGAAGQQERDDHQENRQKKQAAHEPASSAQNRYDNPTATTG